MKLTDREIIRLALEDAISWQAELIAAYASAPDDPDLAAIKELLADYQRVLKKRYSPRKCPTEGMAKVEARTIGLSELRKLPQNWPTSKDSD